MNKRRVSVPWCVCCPVRVCLCIKFGVCVLGIKFVGVWPCIKFVGVCGLCVEFVGVCGRCVKFVGVCGLCVKFVGVCGIVIKFVVCVCVILSSFV